MMTWFEHKPATPHRAHVASGGDLQQRTLEIGGRLLAGVRKHRKGLFSAGFWSDQLVSWTMKDPAFRTQLFRFIDVFPMLRSPEQIHDYLTDYLSQPGVTLPAGLDLGMQAGRLAKGLVAKTITEGIQAMAGNFIAGSDATAALPLLRGLWKQGLAFSVDLLGEACVSDAEAEVYQRRYLDLLEVLPAEVADWPAEPAAGERSPWPRAANQHLHQGQRPEPSQRRDRLRGLASDPGGRPGADPPQSGPARGDGLLRHGTGGRQRPDHRALPAVL